MMPTACGPSGPIEAYWGHRRPIGVKPSLMLGPIGVFRDLLGPASKKLALVVQKTRSGLLSVGGLRRPMPIRVRSITLRWSSRATFSWFYRRSFHRSELTMRSMSETRFERFVTP